MTHRRTLTYSEAKTLAIKILDKVKRDEKGGIKKWCELHEIPYQSVLPLRSNKMTTELPHVVEKVLMTQYETEVIPITLYSVMAIHEDSTYNELLNDI